MAKIALMEFMRGTGTTKTFQMAIADYVVGSTLYFTAKPAIDNDPTNAAAVINKSFNDSNVVLDTVWATYTCEFLPADMIGITFENGETSIDYVGQFEYLVSGQPPVRFPAANDYIDVRIYAEVKL